MTTLPTYKANAGPNEYNMFRQVVQLYKPENLYRLCFKVCRRCIGAIPLPRAITVLRPARSTAAFVFPLAGASTWHTALVAQ
jgi:hypothetical protein